MTNPNDYWRHQQAAAPHAPPHDRVSPGLPLHSPSPMAPASDDEYPASVRSGDPYAINPWLMVAAAAIVLVYSGPVFGSLYPLATGVALGAGFFVNAVLRGGAPGLGADGRLPFSMLATAVAFWPMMRLDYRLVTTVPAYARVRHAARLVLIGVFFSLATLDRTGSRFFPRSFRQVTAIFTDPSHLIVFVIGALGARWMLAKATRLRATWGAAMRFLMLRPTQER
jgi:hypothetical protein